MKKFLDFLIKIRVFPVEDRKMTLRVKKYAKTLEKKSGIRYNKDVLFLQRI